MSSIHTIFKAVVLIAYLHVAASAPLSDWQTGQLVNFGGEFRASDILIKIPLGLKTIESGMHVWMQSPLPSDASCFENMH